MEIIRWNKDISVNNSSIDSQHKRLIGLTNNLILQSNAKANSSIINESLSELLKYAREHFRDEEKLLKEHNYPKLEAHRKSHEKFIYKIAMFCKDVIDGKDTVTEEMIRFLADWLLTYTSIDDQDYKKYI